MAETYFQNPSIIKYIISASDIRGYENAKSVSASANIGNLTSDTPLIFNVVKKIFAHLQTEFPPLISDLINYNGKKLLKICFMV